ncbi:MAG: hypothetical protein ABIZ57_05290 [Candidatus Limnocylindria bacterium]
MNKRTRWLVGGALALSLVGAGVGIGLAETTPETNEPAEGTDSDQPLTGTDREKAEAAALASVGGGTVTETEVGDDGAAYGVEIRRDDGSQVEVNLDESFTVIGSEADDD